MPLILSSSPTGLDEGLTSLSTPIFIGGKLNLSSQELIHLIGRFNHGNLRPSSCTMNSKDVYKLKEKLLDEYYIKIQGRGY